jgi:hypothetical protein
MNDLEKILSNPEDLKEKDKQFKVCVPRLSEQIHIELTETDKSNIESTILVALDNPSEFDFDSSFHI